MKCPRIVVAASRGGSGKTLLSVGMIAAWRAEGKNVIPFKKGPDYIDAGWLALAAGRPCRNLDTFLIPPRTVFKSFLCHSSAGDISVIEGNRGLYDGLDYKGATSTAELAKLLNAPVILCINSTKTTRTMAAVVVGCIHFDPDVDIKGVILNHVAGSRHESILRKSIEYYCGIPVVGAVPKLDRQRFPERHMGLVPTPEHEWAKGSVEEALRVARNYLDLGALERIAAGALAIQACGKMKKQSFGVLSGDRKGTVKIGIVRDSAFQFYYPENMEALQSAGAELVFISPLSDDIIPEIHALYIGGGFPETHVEALAENTRFKEQLKFLVGKGLPVYAECGGLMYLGDELVFEGRAYPMAGILPVVFGFSKRPQGHGYTIAKVEKGNPFYRTGTVLKGHEFHYSKVIKWRGKNQDLAFALKKGVGFENGRDGVCYKNVLAAYIHIHALGTPAWAKSMVARAELFQKKKRAASLAS
ncbi:MAG: cobyrinic acid a,c-diamide synthase [Deltaproteobacteria bacterium RBG_13_49_15]|nr:MAG: cobyrinic acid a,c-diamide synthase [Deltaproteobacteria bacterium RBG_13_49_15]